MTAICLHPRRWSAHARGMAVVLLVFIISRLVYAALSLTFIAKTLDDGWQFIDPALLRTKLWESLYYLHSQPPFFNLLLGVMLKLFPTSAVGALQGLFVAMGAAIAVCMYQLMSELGLRPTLSAVLTSLFVVGPSCITHENWLLYPYLEVLLLLLQALCLLRYVRTRRILVGLLFFTLCALLCLTRSLFHVLWMVAALVVVMIATPGLWRKSLVVGALPLLLVLAFYVKNWLIFGHFTASSWMGMNLARITTERMSLDERFILANKGVFTRIAVVPPFFELRMYEAIGLKRPQATGIAVLDQVAKSTGAPNYNHLMYVAISEVYLRDALTVVKSYPATYLGGVAVAARTYFLPASDDEHLEVNRVRMGLWERAYNAIIYGQLLPRPDFAPPSWSNTGFTLILVHIVLLAYGVYWGIERLRRRERPLPHQVGLLFVALNMTYVMAAAILLELGENYRFRFSAEPLMFTLLGVTVDRLWRRWRARSAPVSVVPTTVPPPSRGRSRRKGSAGRASR